MGERPAIDLTLADARRLVLSAQGLLDPPREAVGLADVVATIDRLGAVQIDAISVAARTQYLVLWSRLGPYPQGLLDAALHPHRATFEYWCHAASIVPMADYPYYRPHMLRHTIHPWSRAGDWLKRHAGVAEQVLGTVRERGPLPSSAFERAADGRRAQAWDWYGPKETRAALEMLWTAGELMVHSRRTGQKLYDLRDRVLGEAFGARIPADDALPSPEEQLRHFLLRGARALGVLTPSWFRDYFPTWLRGYFLLALPDQSAAARRAALIAMLDRLALEGALVPARIEGVREPAYLLADAAANADGLQAAELQAGTRLLSPFDSLLWDRARTRALFGYDVCFEAYVVPEKRRFGYYCLAILHRGRLVGRLDPKLERSEGRLLVQALHLEPGVEPDAGLVEGLARSLRSLASFLGAGAVTIRRAPTEALRARLDERVNAQRQQE